jgi:signal transduction histidine kinase
VDGQQRLWIASTVSGLGRIDDLQAASPRVTWYGTREGLSSNTAWVVVEHTSGDILIGTGRGVDRFTPATGRIVHHSPDDGVPRGEIWGATRDRAGQIWLATTDGVARLAPYDAPPTDPPVSVITGVRVGGVSLPVRADGAIRVDAFTVEPGARTIEIDFVSPGARDADGLGYQHQLKGIDRDWTTTKSRTVTLAGAAPGRYEFLVRAALGSAVVGPPASVEFSVLAPMWQRGWFIAMVCTGLGAVVFVFHRARVGRLVEVERVRSRIAADLHDGVGASLSRIAILSEVVRQRAEAALPDTVPALASIADNARDVIDDMSDAVWSIDPRLDNLRQVIVRVRAMASDLFAGQPIAWSVDPPDSASQITLTPEQRRHLYLILKESLTNVLRHAKASRVGVRIITVKGRLRLDVEDDGVGMLVGPSASAGSGRGLENMRARAAALGGALTVMSRPDGRGTRVSLELPVPHGHAVGAKAAWV